MNAEEQRDVGSVTKKVFVVERHAVVRMGLIKLINAEPDLEVCGEAQDESDAIEASCEVRPDVAVVDWPSKEGESFELITWLRRLHPCMSVLVLSIHEELFYAERALGAGASGYLMKQEASGKIIEAIRRVAGGQTYLSERAVSAVSKSAFAGWPTVDAPESGNLYRQPTGHQHADLDQAGP